MIKSQRKIKWRSPVPSSPERNTKRKNDVVTVPVAKPQKNWGHKFLNTRTSQSNNSEIIESKQKPVHLPESRLKPKTWAKPNTPLVKSNTKMAKSRTPVTKCNSPEPKLNTPMTKSYSPVAKTSTPVLKLYTSPVKFTSPVFHPTTPGTMGKSNELQKQQLPAVIVPNERPVANRCCFTSGDFEQSTEQGIDSDLITYFEEPGRVQCEHIFPERFGFDSQPEDNLDHSPSDYQIQEIHEDNILDLHKTTSPLVTEVKVSSQVVQVTGNIEPDRLVASCSTQWHNVDKVEDLEQIFELLSKVHNTPRQFRVPPATKERATTQWQDVNKMDDIENIIKPAPLTIPALPEEARSKPIVHYQAKPIKVGISDIPRIKKIADRFSIYKTANNLELRRLEEKVVCVEYDIYDKSSEVLKPVQVLRAFFSIKPPCYDVKDSVKQVPPEIKAKLNVNSQELTSTEKEIEIIDAKIDENISYLEDFRYILKRKKKRNSKKMAHTLDLKSLYEIARRQKRIIDNDFSDANVLSKEELSEMKDLILKSCSSSVHGVSRKKFKGISESPKTVCDCIVAEMFQENSFMTL